MFDRITLGDVGDAFQGAALEGFAEEVVKFFKNLIWGDDYE